jgi:capsule biosynthesis phosphatase
MKKIYIDIDGVICRTKKNFYKKSKPNKQVIKLINDWHELGKTIIIFTARYMGRNNDNVNKAKKMGYNSTFKQLKRWGLKFDKLVFGKPTYDIIIDDKAINFKKDWYKKFNFKLKKNKK